MYVAIVPRVMTRHDILRGTTLLAAYCSISNHAHLLYLNGIICAHVIIHVALCSHHQVQEGPRGGHCQEARSGVDEPPQNKTNQKPGRSLASVVYAEV